MDSGDVHDKKHSGLVSITSPVNIEATAVGYPDLTPEEERALVRKIDFRLIPWLSLLYLLSFLDRTSIGNASLYGLKKDLHLKDQQYLWCLTIFFFSYCIFEVPSNVLLKRLKPHIWLSLLMVGWGIVMTVQGLVHNFQGLMGARWMLGTMEAGLFPGVSYYLSCWYKRSEFGLRLAIFFSAATASGAFGGLLAAAISNMHGIGHKPGWAWIFVIEGLMTVVAGIMSFWLIQDFPDTARFLSDRERAAVIKRLQGDDQFSAEGEEFNKRYVFQAFGDWKVYLGILCYMGCDEPLYAFSLFTPTIINKLGYTATPANLLSVPVYVWAAILTVGVGFLADRTGYRGRYNLVFFPIGVIGYIILMASRNAALSYFAVYLAASGIYPLISNTIAWMSNNFEGSYKRSVALAMIICMGNLNGAVSSNTYRAVNAPWYRQGHAVVLSYIVLGIVSTSALTYLLDRENKARDAGLRNELIVGEGADEKNLDTAGLSAPGGTYVSVAEARRAKGDQWSGYRYML